MTRYRIFVVDDEPSTLHGLAFGLDRLYRVDTFPAAEPALEALTRTPPDLVLLDIGLPGMNGLEALKAMRLRQPDLLVVMVTAYEDVGTAVSAMKAGAHDYVTKPIHLETLKITLGNALETLALRREVRDLQERCVRENLPCIVGESHVIQDVVDIVSRAAQSPDAAVLITGESGTGKELLARAVHFKSPNHKGPFVSLNCAALPAELIESELFGYAPGAFSGARATGKIGLIQEAEGGTLFLDEVGDLSPEGQAKLLRFLESGEYYQVGDTRLRRSRVRVVAATNQNPETLMAERRLRPDLFYRLAVIRIQTPSLRERPEDVLPIARFFLEDFARKYGKAFTGIAASAAARLEAHPWPGNIRELRNAVERGVLLGRGPLLEGVDLALGTAPPTAQADAPSPASWPTQGFPPLPPEGLDLAALEAHFIREAQQRSGGNDRAAARLLCMSYYAFRYRKQRLDAGD